MHHIAGAIEDWVQEEEAKYQADLLAQEVERHAKELADKEKEAEREAAAATRKSYPAPPPLGTGLHRT